VWDVTYTISTSPDRFTISDFADSACINPKYRVLARRVHLTSNGVFANYALNNQENFVLWLNSTVEVVGRYIILHPSNFQVIIQLE
jgi:hypothetical protein